VQFDVKPQKKRAAIRIVLVTFPSFGRMSIIRRRPYTTICSSVFELISDCWTWTLKHHVPTIPFRSNEAPPLTLRNSSSAAVLFVEHGST
jgi:hypothetical protein